MHWAGKRLHAPLNRTTLQALQLAEAGENYGSIVATCGATLLVEEKSPYGVARGQGEPEIDYHSIVLEQTEQTIAEIRGAPDTLCMMDYMYTVREIKGGAPTIEVTEGSEVEPGPPLTPVEFQQEHHTANPGDPNDDVDKFYECPWRLPRAYLLKEQAPPLPTFAPEDLHTGCVLVASGQDASRSWDMLCLHLEGDGWGDFLSNALPGLIGMENINGFVNSLLVTLKRGCGRVGVRATATALPPHLPVIRLHFPLDSAIPQLSVHTGQACDFRLP